MTNVKIENLVNLLENDTQDFIELRKVAHDMKAGEIQEVLWHTEDFMETENQINAFNIVKSIYQGKRLNKKPGVRPHLF